MSESLVIRREPHVTELVDMMDRRLLEADGDIQKVYSKLSATDLGLIEEEIRRASGHSPESVRYYLENYHVINAAPEEEPMSLMTLYPFKDSQEILWEMFSHCRRSGLPFWVLLLKCRQIGWSTLCQAILFQATIFNRFINSLTLADERVRSEWLYNMSKLAFDFLPFWMKPEVQFDVKGTHLKFDRKDERERMTSPGLRSALYCDAANKLTGVGRGMTFHCVHASEISNYRNPGVITDAIMPAARTHESHPLSMFVLEGTAKGRNYFFSKFWKSLCEGRYEIFRIAFCGWWQEQRCSTPFANDEQRTNFRPTLEEEQLSDKIKNDYGYEIQPEQWNFYRQTRQMMTDAEGDPDAFEHEYPTYPEAAFRSAGKCFFPKNSLMEMERRDVRHPLLFGDLEATYTPPLPGSKNQEPTRALTFRQHQSRDDSPLWVWELPKKSCVYYIGADPGYGVANRDFSVASVWKIPLRVGEEHEQVAEYKYVIDPRSFARTIANLGYWYNTCEVSAEMRPITTVIDDLQHALKYPRLYRYRRYDKTVQVTNWFGWETNSKTRSIMMDRTKSLMLRGILHIRSQRLLDECFGFVDSVEKPGHFEGEEHDDCLFAAMIAIACLMDLNPSLLLDSIEQDTAKVKTQTSEGLDFYNSDYSPIYDDQESNQYAGAYDEL